MSTRPSLEIAREYDDAFRHFIGRINPITNTQTKHTVDMFQWRCSPAPFSHPSMTGKTLLDNCHAPKYHLKWLRVFVCECVYGGLKWKQANRIRVVTNMNTIRWLDARWYYFSSSYCIICNDIFPFFVVVAVSLELR